MTAFVTTDPEIITTTTNMREGNGTRSPDGYTDSTIGEPDEDDDDEAEDEEGVIKRESTISRYARKRLVNYCPSWPVCRYSSRELDVRIASDWVCTRN